MNALLMWIDVCVVVFCKLIVPRYLRFALEFLTSRWQRSYGPWPCFVLLMFLGNGGLVEILLQLILKKDGRRRIQEDNLLES